ncbi:MAG: cyclic nucleotide-binding domain-containing protein [Elusimicrobia bacterium]|nr:cyclic nucleotide-binding domain-containing protein [Elusimicrobiota bacterium]
MPNEDTIFLKTSVDVLSFFDPEQLRRITPDIERHTYKKDETVIFKGQITDGFYIVRKGKVNVLLKPKPGTTEAAAPIPLGTGDFFGEMSILEETAATAAIKAAEDGTEILTIPSGSFQKLLDMQPLLKKGLLDKIAKRRPPKK